MENNLKITAKRHVKLKSPIADFIAGAKFVQEKICEPEIIQKIRATKSDAEARRIIRTLLK